jgi:hypothetical protein
MTLTTSPKPARPARAHTSHSGHRSSRDKRAGRAILGRYSDSSGRLRELVARPGHGATTLVLDRDAATLGDRRLVAHLAADEPLQNADLVCRHYLHDTNGRWCRPVTPDDLHAPDPTPDCAADSTSGFAADPTADSTVELVGDMLPADADGRAQRLGLVQGGRSIPELRWLAPPRDGESCTPQPLSLREVVGSLESYEPARALTVCALERHRDDPTVSVAVLRAELARLDASRIVLNRGLRRAVLDAMRTRGLSMSEIAVRCGRVKYDARGNVSGETSWLARRVGISPEGGERTPTPWIHSEVLGLIARAGLGISPRDVELG